MKVITAEEKIQEIELGIRLIKLEKKGLEIKKESSELCESIKINQNIILLDNRIVNMNYRIDQLEFQW